MVRVKLNIAKHYTYLYIRNNITSHGKPPKSAKIEYDSFQMHVNPFPKC